MLISGIQELTTIDYPNKLACVVFTLGCNFRCAFCHNPEFVLPNLILKSKNDLISENAFFSFLDNMKGKLDGVSICGGEPTIHPDLYAFAKKIKDKGFLVKLDTNGSNFDIVKKMFENGILDYVAIDAKNVPSKLENTVGVSLKKSFFDSYLSLLNYLKSNNYAYEYRTTIIKKFHTQDDILAICQSLEGISNFYLQNYVSGNTLDSNFKGESFYENELVELKNLCLQYVGKCEIRR